MIFKHFLRGISLCRKIIHLGNLSSLCMKIINSVVVVGLYYGFMTTFSKGISYLFLLQARVMEEGTEKEVAATTGFLTGQLIVFISIYYAPLHLALGGPHTITVLGLPYLLFYFFWNNHKHFFVDDESTTGKSMRSLNTQRVFVFLNNLIYILFNHCLFPSATAARLVNIYLFRYNNKMLFVTSSFVGWFIGHILFMKGVGLVLFWIWQNRYFRKNRYRLAELRDYMAQAFTILLFIICAYHFGRMPSPIFNKKLKETGESEERGKSEERGEIDRDSEIEIISKTKGTKEEQEGYTEEDPSPSLWSEDKEDPDKIDETEEIQVNGKEKAKDNYQYGTPENENQEIEDKDPLCLWFEDLVIPFFDYKQWNRPLRHIKNDRFENDVKNEMSEYFFYTCQSDGNQRISFTYPPSLSIFLEMLKRKMPLCTTEKLSSEELYNRWIYTNEQKKNNLINVLFNRINALEKGSLNRDVLEKRTRLCNDKTEQKCLPERYDPFLNGPYRGTIKKGDSHSSMNMNESLITSKEDSIWLNKLHSILPTKLSKQGKIDSENKNQYLFDAVTTDGNDQTIQEKLKEIRKKVPQWSYQLIDDWELQEKDGEKAPEDHEIRSRRGKFVVIFTDPEQNASGQREEFSLIRYVQGSDFFRDLIKGSIRAQRRKTVIWGLAQINAHSPLFWGRIHKFLIFFSFNTGRLLKLVFRDWKKKGTEFKISDEEISEEKEILADTQKGVEKAEEEERIKVAETWENTQFGQPTRCFLLIAHSILRKYIILPSLIIAKNVSRMLLFQIPEWHEDWQEWSREMHIKCTYNGVPLSETEFPKNWLTDGMHIKILFPFRLKPWRSSKLRSHTEKQEPFYFLTVLGLETKEPFGKPLRRRGPSFFKPISKEFKKKIRKMKKKCFLGLRVLKEKARWTIKIVLFIKIIIQKEFAKVNPNLLFRLREVYELSENKNGKNSIIKKKIININESSSRIRWMDWRNYSLTEIKMKELDDRTSRIINQIEKIKNDKKKLFLDLNISPNETSCDDKRLESLKNFWQILKRRSARLIRKRHFFMKFWIEKIYMDTFPYLIYININILRITVQPFLDLKKIYNENRINLISTINIKKLLSILNISNKNSQKFCGLFSSLSQAYVFYKLSQTQVINKYHLRSVLHYSGTSLFLKDRIKDFIEGIFHSESRHKKLRNSGMNGWKNWLSSHHYQYDLSQTTWSQLMPQEWRKRVNQNHTVSNKASTKLDSYEKNQLIHYEKQNDYAMDSLPSQKEKFKKQYRYDLLSDKYINYEERKDSYISASDYLGEDSIIDKNSDRKFFDWRIIDFSLRKKIDIEAWIAMDTGTKSNKNTKIGTYLYTYSIIDKKEKDLSYFAIDKPSNQKPSNQRKTFFDWMGMNEEILNRPVSNLEPWFFPEFLLLYDAYKVNPWIIPMKLLLFHFNGNQNTSKNKNIKGKQKKDLHISSNEKKYLELENKNQEEKEQSVQEDLGSDLPNQQKEVEDYGGSDTQKSRNQKSKPETELDILLKRYLLYPIQLRWDNDMNEKIIANLYIYSFMVRLKNPKEIALSFVQREEINLDIMPKKDKDQTFLTELIKRGILIIEPVRLSIKWDGQFIMYQTIAISLVHKSKYQTNQKCREMGNADKNDFLVPENISSPRRRKELRIRICLNSENMNVVGRNKVFCNENDIRNCDKFLDKRKHLDRDSKKFIKLFKFFLWPNYRLEDLACMNRYWFDTSNGSRFSMSRIYMYL
nr:hypothetical chloroplast RF1 [Sanguinaria canadensis]